MHSRTTAREILDDFAGERLDYWVTGFGTGGTLKGVARVLAKERPETKIVVCEPADAPMLTSGDRRRSATPDGIADREPSGVEAASDAGLEPGLHPEADRRRGRRRRLIDAVLTIAGADAMQLQPASSRRRKASSSASPPARPSPARCRCAASAPKGSTILCMLPDTGERYLSTPLFADIPADMTEDELAIMRSTPGSHLAPKAAWPVEARAGARVLASSRPRMPLTAGVEVRRRRGKCLTAFGKRPGATAARRLSAAARSCRCRSPAPGRR